MPLTAFGWRVPSAGDEAWFVGDTFRLDFPAVDDLGDPIEPGLITAVRFWLTHVQTGRGREVTLAGGGIVLASTGSEPTRYEATVDLTGFRAAPYECKGEIVWPPGPKIVTEGILTLLARNKPTGA